MTNERRSSPRVQISTSVRVESGRSIKRFGSLNLSSGGAFLECELPLPVGVPVLLKFDFPGAGPVEAQGVVRHHNAPAKGEDSVDLARGMGIAFVRVEGEGAQALADRIKALTLEQE